jgi:hypothetical protein
MSRARLAGAAAATTVLKARVAELEAALGRVRALHKARPVGAFDYCEHCEWTWPCPTIRVIEATP